MIQSWINIRSLCVYKNADVRLVFILLPRSATVEYKRVIEMDAVNEIQVGSVSTPLIQPLEDKAWIHKKKIIKHNLRKGRTSDSIHKV